MGLLKKIKAATLMETLIATVLIVIIFVMSSLVLNNLFGVALGNDTNRIEARIIELEYLTIHKKITLPYYEEFQQWQVTIQNDEKILSIEAFQKSNKKTIIRQYFFNEN